MERGIPRVRHHSDLNPGQLRRGFKEEKELQLCHCHVEGRQEALDEGPLLNGSKGLGLHRHPPRLSIGLRQFRPHPRSGRAHNQLGPIAHSEPGSATGAFGVDEREQIPADDHHLP